MSTSRLKSSVDRSLQDQTRKDSNVIQFPKSDKPVIKDFFLPYQWDWIRDDSLLSIGEKGRRVGLSEAQSYRSHFNCMANKLDTYYSTYNLPAAKNFIRKCAKWARAFNQLSMLMYRQKIIDESKITAYRIEYLNGRFIEAISSNPNNFRDKEKCEIVKDEAAFDPHLDETLEAVKALGMWGYPLKILSTHYGDQNPFNKLVQKVKADPSLGRVHYVSFDTAVAQGLYKKICEVTGKIWTPEAEREYVDYWYRYYGESAAQELGAVPRKYGGSKMFHSSIFHYKNVPEEAIRNAVKVRTWDFAATSQEKAKDESFYTATVLTAMLDDEMIVIDVDAKRLSPDDVEDWMKNQARHDDPLTMYVLEEEPGSTGKFFFNHMEKLITNRNIASYTPVKSKVVRAMPLIAALKNDKIVLWERNREKLDEWLVTPMTDFDGTPRPLVNDVTDCVSMMYGYWLESMADWIAA